MAVKIASAVQTQPFHGVHGHKIRKPILSKPVLVHDKAVLSPTHFGYSHAQNLDFKRPDEYLADEHPLPRQRLPVFVRTGRHRHNKGSNHTKGASTEQQHQSQSQQQGTGSTATTQATPQVLSGQTSHNNQAGSGDDDGERPPKKHVHDKSKKGHYAHSRQKSKSRNVIVPETGLSLSYDDAYETMSMNGDSTPNLLNPMSTKSANSPTRTTSPAHSTSPTRQGLGNNLANLTLDTPANTETRTPSPVLQAANGGVQHGSPIRSSRSRSSTQSPTSADRERSSVKTHSPRRRSRTVASILSSFSSKNEQAAEPSRERKNRRQNGRWTRGRRGGGGGKSDAASKRKNPAEQGSAKAPLALMAGKIQSSNIYQSMTGRHSRDSDVATTNDAASIHGRDGDRMAKVVQVESATSSSLRPQSTENTSRSTVATSANIDNCHSKSQALLVSRHSMDNMLVVKDESPLVVPAESAQEDGPARSSSIGKGSVFHSTIGMLRPPTGPFVAKIKNTVKRAKNQQRKE
ncbi:hypothetical protein V1512DRAFT_266890 [Lipomyces arxii]|uniref:uncharacterized protein n=1 Tax=Lipomyces arxii TaxID=56418 RepID=UPI0034CF5EC2